jgi:hypothetical protein
MPLCSFCSNNYDSVSLAKPQRRESKSLLQTSTADSSNTSCYGMKSPKRVLLIQICQSNISSRWIEKLFQSLRIETEEEEAKLLFMLNSKKGRRARVISPQFYFSNLTILHHSRWVSKFQFQVQSKVYMSKSKFWHWQKQTLRPQGHFTLKLIMKISLNLIKNLFWQKYHGFKLI